MKFRTECPLPSFPFKLSPMCPVVAMGSCFAANMTARMNSSLWRAFNPGGTLFNPDSVALVLRALLSENPEAEIAPTLFQSDEMWRSWWGDSSLAAFSRKEVVGRFRERADLALRLLGEAQVLLITFGTAWVYELKGNPLGIVANCHRQPQDIFTRRRLGINEIVEEWEQLLEQLEDRFPNLEIMFTVSPVRHVKDGLEGNNRSKAVLMLAVEEICRRRTKAHYFPAYEMVADDLRDYRFYDTDLVHPSSQAVDYIWEKFTASLLDSGGRERLKEGHDIVKGWLHRPLMPDRENPEFVEREKKRKGQILDRFALFRRQSVESVGNAMGVADLPV